MTQRPIFSINRTNYLSKPQAFAKVTYHGFFKCEGKCYPNTVAGIVLENVIIHNILYYIMFVYFKYLFYFLIHKTWSITSRPKHNGLTSGHL